MRCVVRFSRFPYWLCVPSEPLRTLYGVPSAVLQWTAVEGPLRGRRGAAGAAPGHICGMPAPSDAPWRALLSSSILPMRQVRPRLTKRESKRWLPVV